MRFDVECEGGAAPVVVDRSDADTLVVLAHGAGSHMEHRTMQWLAELVGRSGAGVARFNFLYRASGASVPDRMPKLMSTYRTVCDALRRQVGPRRLVIGGHSMGGRAASMVEAEGKTADGLLLFGYPLHPAGKPEKMRDAHLPAIQTPTLQINGTEDELCRPDLMEEVATRLFPDIWTLCWIEAADHSYTVKRSSGRTKADVEADVLEALAGWPPLR